jgi:hypothetical protein
VRQVGDQTKVILRCCTVNQSSRFTPGRRVLNTQLSIYLGISRVIKRRILIRSVRTQWWGEYLDLRGKKWYNGGKITLELQYIHSWQKITLELQYIHSWPKTALELQYIHSWPKTALELQYIHSWPKIIYYSGLVCLIVEVVRSHTDAPHSVGFLWTKDPSVTGSFTWQHKTSTRERHPYTGGFRNRNRGKRAAADPSLRPRGKHKESVVAGTCSLYENNGRYLENFGWNCWKEDSTITINFLLCLWDFGGCVSI